MAVMAAKIAEAMANPCHEKVKFIFSLKLTIQR
jgi:hypothetical protein